MTAARGGNRRRRGQGPRRALLLLTCAAALGFGSAAAAQGDPQRGAEIYDRCRACHSLDRNRSGPKHCGLFGRPAGSVAGYRYSEALRKSGIVWDERSLDRFLADPLGSVPGTRMGYAGVKQAAERQDLIAWLKQAGSDPALCR